jgi:hypothetical protein
MAHALDVDPENILDEQSAKPALVIGEANRREYRSGETKREAPVRTEFTRSFDLGAPTLSQSSSSSSFVLGISAWNEPNPVGS